MGSERRGGQQRLPSVTLGYCKHQPKTFICGQTAAIKASRSEAEAGSFGLTSATAHQHSCLSAHSGMLADAAHKRLQDAVMSL